MGGFGRFGMRGNLIVWLVERDLSLDEDYVIEVHKISGGDVFDG